MTDNPLSLLAGAILIVLGLYLSGMFAYSLFLEDYLFRREAVCTVAKITSRNVIHEERKASPFPTGLPVNRSVSKPSASPSTSSTRSTSARPASTAARKALTATTLPPAGSVCWLYYSFTPTGATTAVSSKQMVPRAVYEKLLSTDSVKVYYLPRDPSVHKLDLPVDYTNFWLMAAALIGLGLFIAFLGYTFIFPEEGPEMALLGSGGDEEADASEASLREGGKSEKRKQRQKKGRKRKKK